jgi:hypothetical protein
METMRKATETAVQEMLAEAVGSLTDSGGYGGRAYTKYVGIDWSNIPQETLTAERGIQRSLYHHLVENLSIESELTEKMHKKLDEEPLKLWGDFINDYCISQKWDRIMEWHSLEPDDNSNLNGHFSASVIEDEHGNEMVIIQTHNGMDYRMGWSTPYVFSPSRTIGVQDSDLFRVSECGLYCSNGHRWWSDDGNTFESGEDMGTFTLSSHYDNDSDNLILPIPCPMCGNPLTV